MGMGQNLLPSGYLTWPWKMAHLLIDDFTINTSIYKGFSVAMLNNQMVSETD